MGTEWSSTKRDFTSTTWTDARVDVVESIRQILSEPDIEYDDVDGQKLEISDEAGETLLVVPF